eukprot:COSAG01_NODE_1557_length_9928_cov_7.869977_5_plen_175_part_00
MWCGVVRCGTRSSTVRVVSIYGSRPTLGTCRSACTDVYSYSLCCRYHMPYCDCRLYYSCSTFRYVLVHVVQSLLSLSPSVISCPGMAEFDLGCGLILNFSGPSGLTHHVHIVLYHAMGACGRGWRCWLAAHALGRGAAWRPRQRAYKATTAPSHPPERCAAEPGTLPTCPGLPT